MNENETFLCVGGPLDGCEISLSAVLPSTLVFTLFGMTGRYVPSPIGLARLVWETKL